MSKNVVFTTVQMCSNDFNMSLFICCRFCLNTYDLSYIFEIDKELFEYIEILTHTKLTPDDSLCTSICNKCIIFLKRIHSFKLTSIAAEKTLNDQVQIETFTEYDTVYIKSECKNDEQSECENSHNNYDQKNETLFIKVDNELPKTEVDSAEDNKTDFSNLEDPMQDMDYKDFYTAMDDVKIYDDQEDTIDEKLNETEAISQKVIKKYNIKNKTQKTCKKINKHKDAYSKIIPPNVKIVQIKSSDKKDPHIKSESKLKVCIKSNPQVREKQNLKKSKDITYPCEICGIHQRKSNMQFHINKHNNIFPYECNKCEKKFSAPSSLKIHNYLCHDISNINWEVCDICDKKFKSKSHLSSHKVYHFPPTIPCDKCGKLFKKKKALKIHQFKHTQERNFKCDVCQKAYITAYTLRVHMRIHTNEKPYTCRSCGMAFAYNCLKKAHITKYHPELNE